jgi:diketogulonate reductase-like aldo/keto reductase
VSRAFYIFCEDKTPEMSAGVPAVFTLAAAAASVPTVPISPGIRLPYISLGTGSGMLRPGSNVKAAVQLWLTVGGTAIDTAFDYRDESAVAKGIAASSAPAPFVITKIPCSTYAEAAANIDSNLAQLNVASTGLLLIHFPQCAGKGSTEETWRALEDAQAAGKARAIGVSNFGIAELDALRQYARKWPPAVNQCSLSVGFHDDPTIECAAKQTSAQDTTCVFSWLATPIFASVRQARLASPHMRTAH